MAASSDAGPAISVAKAETKRRLAERDGCSRAIRGRSKIGRAEGQFDRRIECGQMFDDNRA